MLLGILNYITITVEKIQNIALNFNWWKIILSSWIRILSLSLKEMLTEMKTIASGSRVNAWFKQLLSVLNRVIIQQEKEMNRDINWNYRFSAVTLYILQLWNTFCVHETDYCEKVNTGHNLPVVAESVKMHCSKLSEISILFFWLKKEIHSFHF